MTAHVVYHPLVPHWVALPLAGAWLLLASCWAYDRWRIGHPRKPRATPAPQQRPYDWQVDGDCTYRQPTHVHRRGA
jgi:hypothetical protein